MQRSAKVAKLADAPDLGTVSLDLADCRVSHRIAPRFVLNKLALKTLHQVAPNGTKVQSKRTPDRTPGLWLGIRRTNLCSENSFRPDGSVDFFVGISAIYITVRRGGL
jgi:hypothetical protein